MKYVLPLLIILSFMSCDVVMQTHLVNNGSDKKIHVKHAVPRQEVFMDNDTLVLVHNKSKEEMRIIRNTTSDSTYSFLLPSGYSVMLRPLSLGSAIRNCHIQLKDSTRSILASNRKSYRALKKSKKLKVKHVLIFPTSLTYYLD